MRNTLYLLSLTLVALLGAGCAGPEQKLGRGMSNFEELSRGGEFERALEQEGVFNGPDVGFNTGIIKGIDRTIGRAGIGVYEIVTFPLPPYGPVFTDTFSEKPLYPDEYQPRKWSDASQDSDRYLGFSGGDVAPWFPGNRWTIFDN